jgi:hypothetical protein
MRENRITYREFYNLDCWKKDKSRASALGGVGAEDAGARQRYAPPEFLEPVKGFGKGSEFEGVKLAPLVVWTQIRSYIKGGIHAAFGCQSPDFKDRPPGTPMYKEEYCCTDGETAQLGKNSGALPDRLQRRYAYVGLCHRPPPSQPPTTNHQPPTTNHQPPTTTL